MFYQLLRVIEISSMHAPLDLTPSSRAAAVGVMMWADNGPATYGYDHDFKNNILDEAEAAAPTPSRLRARRATFVVVERTHY
jgi:hypothetical protein